MRKFTKNNYVTVEFDPFGLSVKYFQTGMHLMRCESRGSIFPITTIFSNQVTSPSNFLASTLLHDQLCLYLIF